MSEAAVIPAAGRAAFTKLYDPIVALTTRESTFRGRLLDAVVAGLPEQGRVVDVGCGTGTFAIKLAAARPDATVVGIDADPAILDIARAKAGAGALTLREGRAEATGEAD